MPIKHSGICCRRERRIKGRRTENELFHVAGTGADAAART